MIQSQTESCTLQHHENKMNGNVASDGNSENKGDNSRKGTPLSCADSDSEECEQQRSSFWVRLKKRWNRRGVLEVDIDHHRFQMLNAFKVGLRKVILEHPELSAKDNLEREDYTDVLEERIPLSGGKEFVFQSFASRVFATLRRSLELSEEEYLETLAPKSLPFLEYISNSKSGQDFFFSNNQRFLLKTERPACIYHFYNVLSDYIRHLLRYPHTLLVKFLGLYSIKMPGTKKKYFMVMQSVFYPGAMIEERFDLKGCTACRFEPPNPPGSNILKVLKDVNFSDERIELGVQGDWFRRQLLADTDFLKSIRVQDYSLLVAKEPLPCPAPPQDLPTVVTRVTRSVSTNLFSQGTGVRRHSANLMFNSLSAQPELSDVRATSPRRHSGKSNAVAPLPNDVTSLRVGDAITEDSSTKAPCTPRETRDWGDDVVAGNNTTAEPSDSRGDADSCGEGQTDSLKLDLPRTSDATSSMEVKRDDAEFRRDADTAEKSPRKGDHCESNGKIPNADHSLAGLHGPHGSSDPKTMENQDVESPAVPRTDVRETPPTTASDVNIVTPRSTVFPRSISSRPASVSQVSHTRSEQTTFTLELQSLPGSVMEESSTSGVAVHPGPRTALATERFCSLKDLEAENRRLLPNCVNPLHIMDGPRYRYYIGLVDFFTQYRCWQRTGRYVKTVRYRTKDHSTLPPNLYADRLVNFVLKRVQ